MKVSLPLTAREIRLLLSWSASRQSFPDDARVRRKLTAAMDVEGSLDLSRVQVQILNAWAEDWWATHYGGGQVVNPDEEAILSKIRTALGWD
ncbi:MAG: hypothetical protein HN712_17545 [Gemmatimonadetes bacterium]|jgi:hypothetical protein|nr:hypothetical protein [Gemmatimonadota bacterium]MBT7862125.1 hypothetical protein [Gemmatimonadota bacterium]